MVVIKYKDDAREIYPETGRSSEIAAFLETKYDLLYYDKRNNAVMFGRKQ